MFQHYMYRSNAYSSTGSGRFANHISDGWRDPGHRAIDIIIEEWRPGGTGYIRDVPIYAQGTGIVTGRTGDIWDRSGYTVTIRYNGNNITASYSHLKNDPNTDTILTDDVTPATRIGITSDTGVLADPRTGNHLHLEVRVGGELVNPRGYFPTETFSN